jgi:hypothetical protein
VADYIERPEDTVRRFAKKIVELEAWQARYREAADLWDGLRLRDNDQVVSATMIAKISDFESGSVNVGTSCSDGTDWIEQLGLFEAWKGMCVETRIERRDD